MRSADHDVGVLAAVADVLAELEWHGLADEYQALAGSLAEVSTVRDSDAFMALTIELWELADPTTVDRFDPWERALAAARVAVGNAVRAARSGL